MTAPKERILLVDDEPRLLSGLKRNLGLHFSIVTAQSGAAALKTIEANDDIAVIVADMQMPEMNGVDLLKRVKEDAPQIRRMMLTGNSDQDTAIAAVNEGAVMRFMRKPCDPATLKEAIENALEDYRFSLEQEEVGETTRRGTVARDSFLAMMNHEMRTPLNHIIGLAQLIDIPEVEATAPSRNYLKTMRESANSLLHTLARILDYARISSEDHSAFAESFDIVDVLKDEVDRAKDEAEKSQITVAFDTLRRKHDFVGSADDVRTAVRELLSNAVKFNKQGGHVSVTLRTKPDKIGIRITDTGAGIDDEQLSRVTGAFTQADEGHARAHEGIGLGLSLASLIAETHKGTLSISSEEEKGTTVILTLTSADSAAQSKKSAA